MRDAPPVAQPVRPASEAELPLWPMDGTSVARRGRTWAALIIVVCAIVYANGLNGAFTYDDKAIVRDNSRLRSPREIRRIFSTHYFGGPRGTGSIYRPVLLLSFAVQWWIHGRQVVAFHVVNLLLHIVATLLLARLLLRVGLSPPIVWSAMLIFAIHPIHVEAVTSLVGRGETLSAILVLSFLTLALRLLGGRSRLLPVALALPCYGVAILTKESASVAPALAFLLFLFVLDGSWRERIGSALRRGLPLFAGCAAVLAAVFGLRHWVFGGFLKSPATGFFEVENPLAPLPAAQRAVNACLIFFRYLGRCVLPLHLSADESAWSIPVLPLRSVSSVLAAVLVAALAIAALRQLPRRSLGALGFLFMAVAFLPASNLLFPIGTIFAERVAYLPSAGVCLIAAAALMGPGARQTPGRVDIRRMAALSAVCLLLGARTITRNSVWWTDQGLFDNTLATSPGSAKAHYNAAYVAAFYHRDREALAEYTRAVEIYDGYWDAWAGKGRMEKQLGMLDLAERSYEKSIAVYPGYENGYFGLGLVREARGDVSGAAEAYRRGLEDNPASLPLAFRLAAADSALGRLAAREEWEKAVRIGPDSTAVRAEFAAWLLLHDSPEAARREAREALRRDPRAVAALRVIADADERQGRLFAAALAREKIFRLTRLAADLGELERLASADEAYRRRFEALFKTPAPVNR